MPTADETPWILVWSDFDRWFEESGGLSDWDVQKRVIARLVNRHVRRKPKASTDSKLWRTIWDEFEAWTPTSPAASDHTIDHAVWWLVQEEKIQALVSRCSALRGS